MNFNFGEILTRAWQIVWKHKVLWIFGILASCSRGGSSFNSNSSSGGGDGGGFGQPDLPPQVMQWIQTIEENLVAFTIALCVVVLLIWAVTLFLGTIGKIGLIRGTFQADGGAEALIFGQLFSESMPYFWRMFGLSLIVAIPILVVFAALFAGLILFAIPASAGSDEFAVGLLAFLPLLIGCFCLLIPVMFVVGMIVRQAENAIVLEEMGVLPGLSRGWEVFRKNLGPVIVMAIILAIVGVIAGFILAIPFFLIFIPGMIAYFAGGGQNNTPLILMGVCFCLYFPVSLLINGVLIAYTESAWTLTYMRLTKPQDNVPMVLEANA